MDWNYLFPIGTLIFIVGALLTSLTNIYELNIILAIGLTLMVIGVVYSLGNKKTMLK